MRPISSDVGGQQPQFFSTENLSAGYGHIPVVKGVSLGVDGGEIVCIVGPNGAGKSTLLKAMTGGLQPAAGIVNLDGEDVTGLSSHLLARKGLAYVPQISDVFETLTVAENLEMGGYLLERRQVAERCQEVLSLIPQLQTLVRRVAASLSGGERKLLAIARALMVAPSVLVLDEPTANLSSERSREILQHHVRDLADRGTAVLLVEQNVRQALAVSDRAFVLVNGQVAVESSGHDLLHYENLSDIFLRGTSSVNTLETGDASNAN